MAVHRAVSISPRSIRRFRIRYEQAHRGRRAVYVATTARTWPGGVGSAVFEVRDHTRTGGLQLSLPAVKEHRAGGDLYRVTTTSFVPDREFVIAW